MTRRPIVLPPPTWWARVAVAGGIGYLFATNDGVTVWRQAAQALLAGDVESTEFAEYIDVPHGLYRVAAFAQGRLEGCLFVGPAEAAPQWDAVKEMFAADALAAAQRLMVLAGRSAAGLPDVGPVVCSCFGVGLNVIRGTLRSGAATNVEEIGKALRAGTNCGSCLPELKRIVQGSAQEHARSAHERVAV